ncbi:MAG: DUF3795 domain-containing protein [Candidatus Thorarchaeota archaeon]
MTAKFPLKEYPTIACCGLDCGLCPVYYTEGASKCPGCCGPNFANKHPSCSIINCCVKTRNFETCAECDEFPCSKIKKWDHYDSFISHRVSLANLRLIKKIGLEKFFIEQQKRIELLKIMLENFNEGRSKSFFCQASALLQIDNIQNALEESYKRIKDENIPQTDLKMKSNILRENLNIIANRESVELRLKRK